MNTLPSSLQRASLQWFVAVAITVVGDLARLLATFMPMKTILILSLGDVPGFFPAFLVNGGAVFAAIILLGVAAFFGFVAWLAEFVVEWMDGKPAHSVSTAQPRIDPAQEVVKHITAKRNLHASLVLTLPVMSVLILVSIPYLILLSLWILISGVLISWRGRRSHETGPYFSGFDQVSHDLAKWLKKSALLSMVALSLVTLLISPPTFGPTAILIAAIFGRRLTVAVSKSLPELTAGFANEVAKHAGSVVAQVVTNQPKAEVAKSPSDYFSSKVGIARLGKILESRGFEPHDFQFLGAISGQSVSVLAGRKDSEQRLFRVFGLKYEQDRDRELRWRNEPHTLSPYPPGYADKLPVAGFPALEVALDTRAVTAGARSSATRPAAMRFQIEKELDGVLALNDLSKPRLDHVFWTELFEYLDRARRIPGRHQADCEKLRILLPQARDLIKTLPASLVPSRPLAATDLYVARDKTMCYLGGHTWTIGRMGDAWGKVATYASVLRELLDKDTENPVQPKLVLLNGEVHELERTLRRFRLDNLAANSKAIGARLRAAQSK